MPSNVVVNFLTTQHKSSVGITAAFPDVCKTPAPPAPSPVPIPYPNIGNSSMASVKVTKRVKDNKQKVVIKGAAYSMTSGDEPGVAMGVVSNKIKGKSEVMNTSFNVKFEGKGIGRLGDPHGNNCGSKPNVPCPAEGQPPNAATPAQQEEQKKACEQVRDECGVDPDDFDDTVKECGMDPLDAKNIQQCCVDNEFSTTFRSTNTDCAQWFNKGHPAKGCDIPQKTITDARIAEHGGQHAGAASQLKGLVGDWDPDTGKLRGVMTPKGGVPFGDGMPPPPRNAYTGDYDAHDFFGHDGSRVTDLGHEEWVQYELNDAIGHGKSGNPMTDMVRHGAQSNYRQYCDAKGKKPIPSLLVPDLDEPLLAFDQNGHLYKIETEDQLRAYYKCKGQPVPEEWDWDEDRWQKEKAAGNLDVKDDAKFDAFAKSRGKRGGK